MTPAVPQAGPTQEQFDKLQQEFQAEQAANAQLRAALTQFLQQQANPPVVGPVQVTPATPHSKLSTFFHVMGVVAPVAAMAFSIYSNNPANTQKAQQTAQLLSALGTAFNPQPAA